MRFKTFYSLIICALMLVVTACSDPGKEKELVDLFTTASQDLIAINFPAGTTEDIVSINTFVDYRIEGLKSNGVDVVAVDDNISWSLSDGAASSIDSSGRLSTGPVAENITINAKVGFLTTSQNVFVSAAKFDRVVKLSEPPVSLNMCQAEQIKPVGSYLNDDGTEEIRPVDNTVINTITWLIRNQEDDAPSLRALIKTEDNITMLQGFETGNVIIQARAKSLSSGSVITSADFDQTIDHNLNSFKLCLQSETDLAACSLSNAEIVEDGVVSIIAVGNYQAADGTNYYQNISAYSKWGVDNNGSFASITLSGNRQWLDITGKTVNTLANVSSACGDIVEVVTDDDIASGVVLNEPVTCAAGNVDCLRTSVAISVSDTSVSSLEVTANGVALVDDEVYVFTIRPPTIALQVTANYSDGTSEDVTADINVVYNNRSPLVVLPITGSPGEYDVIFSGIADIQILLQSQVFIAKMTIP